MEILGAVLLFLALFGVGVWRDRRRLRNAVFLGLAVLCALVGLAGWLGRERGAAASVAEYGLLLLPLGAATVLAVLLVASGLTMVRREGRTPANAVSLVAGGLLGTAIVLVSSALISGDAPLTVLAVLAVLVGGYVSFLFLSFLGYAFLYGRMPVHREADYVVVLGAGLLEGSRVGNLLGSRLERGLTAWTEAGRRPLIVTSGGQGPDEDVPESHAMADWLIERGVPAECVLREDRSRSTEENLRFTADLIRARRQEPAFCLVVTNNFHVFRAALTARRLGLEAEVVGAPTAPYFWPSATIREFVAVVYQHKAVNAGVCALLTAPALALWLGG